MLTLPAPCPATCHPPSPLYLSRAAALAAGIPATVPISTVNRLCSSGLMSIRGIAHAILAGETQLGIAAAAESMSLKSAFPPLPVFLVARSRLYLCFWCATAPARRPRS